MPNLYAGCPRKEKEEERDHLPEGFELLSSETNWPIALPLQLHYCAMVPNTQLALNHVGNKIRQPSLTWRWIGLLTSELILHYSAYGMKRSSGLSMFKIGCYDATDIFSLLQATSLQVKETISKLRPNWAALPRVSSSWLIAGGGTLSVKLNPVPTGLSM